MAKILIIDDDDHLRAAMRKGLERAGHSVQDASDGNQGVSLYRADPADVVVTDLIMPEKEGIETIIELREEFPGVRILAISGGGSLEPGEPLTDARFLGADAALSKPFTLTELQEAVSRLL